MTIKTVKDEIETARRSLKLVDSQFREVPDTEARSIYEAAESNFVSSSGLLWWWEDFKQPATRVHFPKQDGFRHLQEIALSENEMLWLIVEEERSDCYPVYEGRIAEIQSIIAECSAFEYYLAPKDLSWLVCENHHDVIFAIGAKVEERLRKIEIQALSADSP